MTVTMINAFTVPPGEFERFLERWKANARTMTGRPGLIKFRLHRALSDNAEIRFVNVAEWEDAAALDAAMAQPEWQESVRALREDPELHVVARPAVYEVIVDVAAGCEVS